MSSTRNFVWYAFLEKTESNKKCIGYTNFQTNGDDDARPEPKHVIPQTTNVCPLSRTTVLSANGDEVRCTSTTGEANNSESVTPLPTCNACGGGPWSNQTTYDTPRDLPRGLDIFRVLLSFQ